MNGAIPWALGYLASCVALLAVFWWLCRFSEGQAPPDPAFRDREDREVAALDLIWDLPTREPLR